MERDVLAGLIAQQLSTAEIAEQLGLHPRIVAGWLREFKLETNEAVRRRRTNIASGTRQAGSCERHGEVEFVARGDGSWRCVRCRSEQVSDARRRRKALLVTEAGGSCVICGYDRCVAALHFHHVDPENKRFGIGFRGAARSLSSMRAEAAKCVLLCSNCHAEVETGRTQMPVR
jgi:hypothetical protein